MPYEVEVKRVPAQHVALVKTHASMATIGEDVGRGFAEIWSAIGSRGVAPTGPPFLVMFDPADAAEGDIELCVPVPERFVGTGPVLDRELEGVMAATTMHRGPYQELGSAYATLEAWVKDHDRELAGPPREVYLTDPGATRDPADQLTEVVFPIR